MSQQKVTPEELVTLAKQILSIFQDEKTFVETLIDEFVYVGFDVLNFMTALKACESNSDKFKKDLVRMIILFLSRGNSVTNMKKRMGPAGKTILDGMISTYGIKAKVGDSSEPNVVTLARVATSFSHVTAKILDGTNLTLPYNIQVEYKNCPKSLSLSSIFSLLPKPFQVKDKEDLINLIGACLYCQYKQYSIINSKNRSRLTEALDIGNHIITYAVISYKSNVFTDEQRMTHSKDLKYYTEGTKGAKPVIALACIKDMMEALCALFSPDVENNFF
ncbi:putative nucleoprotein [Hubei diptera virus 4]|uniref:Nucleoprotein n=1 Tax=Hubei diptera virus 4 TaxID=1922885 RepID=A0A1L3KPJ5_9VIRU|nr:putative nucleoprotein [Hubei diptera virus 4]APG79300.1 putative nucleoprotein [Hubei diptera virus 4]